MSFLLTLHISIWYYPPIMRDEIGRFVKGHTVPSEWIESQRLLKKGKYPNHLQKEKSPEVRKKLSLSLIRYWSTRKKPHPIRQNIPKLKKLPIQRSKQWSIEHRQKMSLARKGKHEPWKLKPRKIGSYIAWRCPWHPFASKRDFLVMEHRLVMERHLGRFLVSNEVVHHLNGDKSDNHIENLELMTKSTHMSFHSRNRKRIRRTSPTCSARSSRHIHA